VFFGAVSEIIDLVFILHIENIKKKKDISIPLQVRCTQRVPGS